MRLFCGVMLAAFLCPLIAVQFVTLFLLVSVYILFFCIMCVLQSFLNKKIKQQQWR